MPVKAQLISKKSDNTTLCRPSEGYEDSIEIDPDQYVEAGEVDGELPGSDEKWPKGAPIKDCVKLGNRILKKRDGEKPECKAP